MSSQEIEYTITVAQSVAILIDGNNIEKSIHEEVGDSHAMLNFDSLIPKLLDNRGLNRLIYFREGKSISQKLAERLHDHYHGSVIPCHKSADIPLTIKATQLSKKVDTIIILSGDSDYVDLVKHLKSEGVRVEIAAIERTTAQILREEADYFVPIKEEDYFFYKPPGGSGGRGEREHSSGRRNNSGTGRSSSGRNASGPNVSNHAKYPNKKPRQK